MVPIDSSQKDPARWEQTTIIFLWMETLSSYRRCYLVQEIWPFWKPHLETHLLLTLKKKKQRVGQALSVTMPDGYCIFIFPFSIANVNKFAARARWWIFRVRVNLASIPSVNVIMGYQPYQRLQYWHRPHKRPIDVEVKGGSLAPLHSR